MTYARVYKGLCNECYDSIKKLSLLYRKDTFINVTISIYNLHTTIYGPLLMFANVYKIIIRTVTVRISTMAFPTRDSSNITSATTLGESMNWISFSFAICGNVLYFFVLSNLCTWHRFIYLGNSQQLWRLKWFWKNVSCNGWWQLKIPCSYSNSSSLTRHLSVSVSKCSVTTSQLTVLLVLVLHGH